MFKLPLCISVIVLIAFGMMMEKAAAGDCNGSRCGCYKGYCWAYVDGQHTKAGDWWCYTQMFGVYDKQSKWQQCTTNVDCYWDRTCGNCVQHKGNDEKTRTVC